MDNKLMGRTKSFQYSIISLFHLPESRPSARVLGSSPRPSCASNTQFQVDWQLNVGPIALGAIVALVVPVCWTSSRHFPDLRWNSFDGCVWFCGWWMDPTVLAWVVWPVETSLSRLRIGLSEFESFGAFERCFLFSVFCLNAFLLDVKNVEKKVSSRDRIFPEFILICQLISDFFSLPD